MLISKEIYSLTHCSFCNSKLKYKHTYYCANQDCKYDYESYPSGIVDFRVPGYIVEIHLSPPKTRILQDIMYNSPKEVVEIGEFFWIDNHNYLDVIERLKKLKVFS